MSHARGEVTDHLTAEEDEALERGLLWELDNVELTTVGMDIGSSTSHLMIARLRLQRQGVELSSRFAVVERKMLHRSEIMLTPYVDEHRELIDAEALSVLADRAHAAAGVDPEDVDTGVVILTGLALERRNSRVIAETFAEREGAFVCATAGHRFEAILAAHGSGAVELSRTTDSAVVNVDIGGGTTKLSWARGGRILDSMAIAVGARLVVLDEDDVVIDLAPSIYRLADAAGVTVTLGRHLDECDRQALAAVMADRIIAAVTNGTTTIEPDLVLEGDVSDRRDAEQTVVSGGVSEYVHGREARTFGDLGPLLAQALVDRRDELPRIHDGAGVGIRATVVGASQHSVSLSGNTIYLTRDDLLPLRNLPVLRVVVGDAHCSVDGHLDVEAIRVAIDDAFAVRGLRDDQAAALMVSWNGPPSYTNLRSLAGAIASSGLGQRRRNHTGLVVALDYDVAGLVGRILSEELGVDELIVLDGLDLTELDFIDLGRRQRPANVVPAVIKSLVFE